MRQSRPMSEKAKKISRGKKEKAIYLLSLSLSLYLSLAWGRGMKKPSHSAAVEKSRPTYNNLSLIGTRKREEMKLIFHHRPTRLVVSFAVGCKWPKKRNGSRARKEGGEKEGKRAKNDTLLLLPLLLYVRKTKPIVISFLSSGPQRPRFPEEEAFSGGKVIWIGLCRRHTHTKSTAIERVFLAIYFLFPASLFFSTVHWQRLLQPS